jgi:hypothetical protein
VGIAADVAVVFYKAIENQTAAVTAGIVSLAVLLGLWLGYPFLAPRELTSSCYPLLVHREPG